MIDAGACRACGERCAVASGCREATAAALAELQAGGNVVDGALVGAAVLCVVLPHAVSLGGDLFGLIRLGGRDAPILAVNATGAAPLGATPELYAARGFELVPEIGPLSIQTPGLVAGFEALRERWATRSRAELLAPAIAYAREGFAVGGRLGRSVAELAPMLGTMPGWRETFEMGGRLVRAGDRLVQERLARTLERIAAEGAAGFYGGPVARDLARTVSEAGGLLSEADLAAVRAEIVRPLAARFCGATVATQPPVSQGVVLLRALRLLEEAVPEPRGRAGTPAYWAQAARGLRCAFAERLALLGDRPDVRAAAEAMIRGRMEAADGQARAHAADGPETTTIAVVDADGNAASLILSVFADLGSGVVGRESGVLLNNRLSAFFLDPSHPNCVAPGKRTIHTLHSFIMVGERGELWAGGSPGGDHQPQVNLQVLARMLDLREEPGTAIRAPRWAIAPGTAPRDLATDSRPRLLMEETCPPEWGVAFAEAGFAVEKRNDHVIGSAKVVNYNSGERSVQAFADHRREASVLAI